MYRVKILLFVLAFNTPAYAQTPDKTSTAGTSSRETLLKDFVARDRGEITALEASSGGNGGVIVGYSSGAVLHCLGSGSCTEFTGTPNTAVEHIAVARDGKGDIAWVSYRHGALYRCRGQRCSKFHWQDAGQQ